MAFRSRVRPNRNETARPYNQDPIYARKSQFILQTNEKSKCVFLNYALDLIFGNAIIGIRIPDPFIFGKYCETSVRPPPRDRPWYGAEKYKKERTEECPKR